MRSPCEIPVCSASAATCGVPAQYVSAQGMCQNKSKQELVRMLIVITISAADGGAGACFECSEVVDLPELAAELLRMLLSLYGAPASWTCAGLWAPACQGQGSSLSV